MHLFCCFSFFHGSVQFSITEVAIGALRLCFPVLHLHHMGWSIEELAPHVTSAQQLLYAGDIQHSVGCCLIIRSQKDPKTCTTKRSCFVFPLLRPTGAFSTLKVLIKLTLLLVLVCVVVDTQGGPAYGVGAETIFHNRIIGKWLFLRFSERNKRHRCGICTPIREARVCRTSVLFCFPSFFFPYFFWRHHWRDTFFGSLSSS